MLLGHEGCMGIAFRQLLKTASRAFKANRWVALGVYRMFQFCNSLEMECRISVLFRAVRHTLGSHSEAVIFACKGLRTAYLGTCEFFYDFCAVLLHCYMFLLNKEPTLF